MRYFNSRPHEEVDGIASVSFKIGDDISTHDLTKRSTEIYRDGEPVDYISTHDLTKRST